MAQTNPTPWAIQRRCDHAATAYKSFTGLHAVLLFHIISMRKRQALAPGIVDAISLAFVNHCSDGAENNRKDEMVSFLEGVMGTTAAVTESLSDAILLSCSETFSIPVVCPATTTVCALLYMHRLQQKYQLFPCRLVIAKRLFLVAYLVAAKYIQANLRSIAKPNTSPAESAKEPSLCTSKTLSDASLLFDRIAPLKLETEVGDPDLICRMEQEFLQFIDYRLALRPSPLHLWSWFSEQLNYYSNNVCR